MPRKKIKYIHEQPYHIVCRTNNKDFFRISLAEVWTFIEEQLIKIHKEYGLRIHSVLLMNNHYHLIASTSEPFFLSDIMHRLQTTISRYINVKSGCINHTFGDRYKASLIENPTYFYHATKYLYQNPVRAGICLNIKDWPYSNLKNFLSSYQSDMFQAPLDMYDFRSDFSNEIELIEDLNKIYTYEQSDVITKATKKSVFKISPNKKMRKINWL